MVIEGFVPSYALEDALETYRSDGYKRLIVTGIAITKYECTSVFTNTAEATIHAIRQLGFTDSIYSARIPDNVYVDRTYHTAIATGILFEEHPEWPKSMNIFSIGVHARRSRMMFKEACGSEFNIGIIAYPDRSFNPDKWWKNSKGFRNVSNEFAATLFVSLFFHPDYDESAKRLKDGYYVEGILQERKQKDIEFADSLHSRFNREERSTFSGFKYFKPDLNYIIKSQFVLDTSTAVFKMPTTTDRAPEYRIYGYFNFKILDSSFRLTAYQNMKYRNHKVFGGQLFLPFTDMTNGYDTYSAGRYMDINIPKTDSVLLDFNTVYNPYCSYSDRWSCPLVPFENHLNTYIRAGEKKYKESDH